MIMSIDELKRHIQTKETDDILQEKLQAIELKIRNYTNNNFQNRSVRCKADIVGEIFRVNGVTPFKEGDTVHVTDSTLNEGLYTVKDADNASFTANEAVRDEFDVLITLVEYPVDVKQGAINLLKWDEKNREKAGIQSETISRHSITYVSTEGDNWDKGYPASLMDFIEPYKKARFGRGL